MQRTTKLNTKEDNYCNFMELGLQRLGFRLEELGLELELEHLIRCTTLHQQTGKSHSLTTNS